MSAVRRPISAPRPYGTRVRVPVARPYGTVRPPPPTAGAGSAALGGALGALGGTLGCLLCLAAIGALGLFSCVVALTAYANEFLSKYKQAEGINSGVGQLHITLMAVCASLFYTLVCRMQRS